jgi:uncharacterized protein YndB with AHSA1/START domain
MSKNTAITVNTIVEKPITKAWELWNSPEHIMKWSHASDDWHTPHAENDLRVGGKFLMRMVAKDGSASFDFIGTYTSVKEGELIEYTIDDGRKVSVRFESVGEAGAGNSATSATKITETFDPESINSLELQREGWQAILENFKKYAEGQR